MSSSTLLSRSSVHLWRWLVVFSLTLFWMGWHLRLLASCGERWCLSADYFHGFFAMPFAGVILWERRGSCPSTKYGSLFGGAVWFGLAIALGRMVARDDLFILSGVCLALALMGWVWMFGGRQLWYWALPATLPLLLAAPLPTQLEGLGGGVLQRGVAATSSFLLQCWGEAAVPWGGTILIGLNEVHLEDYCVGLRILPSSLMWCAVIGALPRWSWWERGILLLAVLPVAFFSTVWRVVIAGLIEAWSLQGHSILGQAWFQNSHGFLVAGVLTAMAAWLESRSTSPPRPAAVQLIVCQQKGR